MEFCPGRAVVSQSDGTAASPLAHLGSRAAAVCVSDVLGGVTGLLAGWVTGRVVQDPEV